MMNDEWTESLKYKHSTGCLIFSMNWTKYGNFSDKITTKEIQRID